MLCLDALCTFWRIYGNKYDKHKKKQIVMFSQTNSIRIYMVFILIHYYEYVPCFGVDVQSCGVEH